MIKRNLNRILIIFISAVLAAGTLLLTACPPPIVTPPDISSGYFNVNLVIIGSEDGKPYTKDVSFTDTAKTVTVDVSYLLSTVDLELTSELAGANIKINGYSLNYGHTVAVSLQTGTNTIPITVTPELVDPITYTLVIKRGVAPGVVLSSDATLSSLSISNVPNAVLHPGFSPDVLDYSSSGYYAFPEIIVAAETSNENSDMTINGEAVASGEESKPISLAYGPNPAIEIVVTAEDEITTKTYKIVVFRSNVQDNEDPVITLIGGSPYNIEVYSEWVEPGYTAHDNIEGDLTSAVKIIGSIDTTALGTQSLSYGVSDASGNFIQVLRTVIIRDTTSPVITLIGADPMRVNLGSGSFTDPGVEVTDNYDTNPGVMATGTVDTSVLGTYQITYTATDSSGNSSSEIRNVVVSNDNDTTPPVITLSGDNPYTHEVNTTWTDPGYSAADTFDGDLTDSVHISGTVNVATLGNTTLYYNVSDSSGNAAEEKSRMVTVSDKTEPVITLLGADSITVAHGSIYADPGALVSDNYDTGLTPTVTGTVQTNTIGSYFLRYDAVDNSSNHAIPKYRTVKVTDQTPPNFNLVGSSSVTIALGTDFTDPLTSGALTASDNIDGNLTSSIVTSGDTVDTKTPGTYHIYYDVSDNAGLNADTFAYTVTVKDQQPPVITLYGEASIEVNFGDAFSDPGALVSDNWDDDRKIFSPIIVDTNSVGVYTLTYNAVDAAGNVATQATRTVRVLPPPDTINPTITLNGNETVTIEYGESYNDPGAIAYDMRNEDPYKYYYTEEEIDVTDNIDYNTLGTYTINYYVEDLSGNSASVSRTLIIRDTTGPVITINGPNPLTVDYGSVFNAPAAFANDTHDGDLDPVDFIITGAGNVDTGNIHGSYLIEYTIADSSGNESKAILNIYIEDLSGPVINLNGENPAIVECGEIYTDAGATADDNLDGNVSASIITSGLPVNTSTPGTHTVEYNVTDDAGNNATSVSRIVSIIDTTAPVIELFDGEVTIEAGSDWDSQDPGFMITDNDTRTYGLEVVLSGLDVNSIGTQTLTYNLSDLSGNAATPVYRTVNVIDSVIPIISLEGVSSMEIDFGTDFTDAAVTASDNYNGDITDNIVVSGDTVDTFTLGTYTIYYDVSDSSGNPALQQSRTVTVTDLSAPEIIILDDNPATVECLSSYSDAGATASDNCDGDISGNIIVSGLPIDTSSPGIHIVTYSVTDEAGHTTTATRTVNIIDTTPPVISLEGALILTVEVNTDWASYEPGFSAADTVDGDISTDVKLSGLNMHGLGVQTQNYDVKDSSGNPATTKSRTVHVVDTTAPVITLIGDSTITINVGSTFSDPGAIVTDNYDNTDIIYRNSTVNTSVAGIYYLKYNHFDENGNAAVGVTRTVIVQ